MKKGILILLGMFMMVSTVEAKNGNYSEKDIRVNYSYENAVNFTERGIEFFIYTNGDFDFNNNYNEAYYGSNRRNNISIKRDYRGRIRRIGSVYINYDNRGNVSRVGNIFMRYNRNRLTKVGNLRVKYNRFGDPIFYGNVKNNFYYDNGIKINLNLGSIYNYNDAYFFNIDFRRNYTKFREDSRYFYYKSNRNAKIGKRNKILKRRKRANSNRNNKFQKKPKNNSYRKSNIKRKTTVTNNRISKNRKTTISKIKRNNRTQKVNKNTRPLKIKKKTKKEINTRRRTN